VPLSIIDVLSLILMAGTGYLGFHRGAMAELSQIGALILGLFISVWLSGSFSGWAATHIPANNHLVTGSLLILLFMGLYLAFRLGFRVIEYLADQWPRWIDRTGGTIIGVFKGAVLIAAATLILDVSSAYRWSHIIRRESAIVNTLYKVRKTFMHGLEKRFKLPDDLRPEGIQI